MTTTELHTDLTWRAHSHRLYYPLYDLSDKSTFQMAAYSVALGVGNTILGLLLLWLAQLASLPLEERSEVVSTMFVVYGIIFAPIIETAILAVLANFISRWSRVATYVVIVALAVAGHTPRDIASLDKVMAFGIFTFQYLYFRKYLSTVKSIFFVSIQHATKNIIVFLIYLLV